MAEIQELIARVESMVEAVDLEFDVDDELAKSFEKAKKSGVDLSEYVQKLWVLIHRRDITVQEYRLLLGVENKNGRALPKGTKWKSKE